MVHHTELNAIFVDIKVCHCPLSVNSDEVFKYIAFNLRKMYQDKLWQT